MLPYLIFTSNGAAHDVEPSVDHVLVSSASLDTVINANANTNEDTTETANQLGPDPSWTCEKPVLSGHSEVKSKLSRPSRSTRCAKVLLSALSARY